MVHTRLLASDWSIGQHDIVRCAVRCAVRCVLCAVLHLCAAWKQHVIRATAVVETFSLRSLCLETATMLHRPWAN